MIKSEKGQIRNFPALFKTQNKMEPEEDFNAFYLYAKLGELTILLCNLESSSHELINEFNGLSAENNFKGFTMSLYEAAQEFEHLSTTGKSFADKLVPILPTIKELGKLKILLVSGFWGEPYFDGGPAKVDESIFDDDEESPEYTILVSRSKLLDELGDRVIGVNHPADQSPQTVVYHSDTTSIQLRLSKINLSVSQAKDLISQIEEIYSIKRQIDNL